MALTVEQSKILSNYKKTHAKECMGLSDAQIISILSNNGMLKLTAEQKQSLFHKSTDTRDNTGLQVEHKEEKGKTNQTKEIYLQSGRKVVVTKTKDGKDVYKYYAADGIQLTPEHFKKQEGVIKISADGMSYTATKMEKQLQRKTKDPLIAKLDQQQVKLNKAKSEQGFLGKSWDWFKNITGIGDGSNKAQKQIDAERKLVNQIKTGKISKKDFKEATGLEYSTENLAKFKKGELSQVDEKINGYKESQEMAVDMAADMTAGIASFGIYTAAVAAAPFTGGASIAVGVAAATASAALIKSGIKYADAKSAGREYTAKEFKKDAFTGAISGVLAPLTAGFGGAVGKGIAVKAGGKVIATEMAEVAGKDIAKQGFWQTFKGLMTKPGSIKLATETIVKDGVAKEVTVGGAKASAGFFLGEAAVSGGMWGGIDGAARTTYDQVEKGEGLDGGAIAMSAVEGSVGGAVAGIGFGGAMKGIGKLWSKAFGKGKTSAKVETVLQHTSILKVATSAETPIQIQQRLLKELEIAKTREDFARITQEIKNLPKTEEFQSIRQRLGSEHLQRYNEWKASQPESTRAIVNMAEETIKNNVEGGIAEFEAYTQGKIKLVDINTLLARQTPKVRASWLNLKQTIIARNPKKNSNEKILEVIANRYLRNSEFVNNEAEMLNYLATIQKLMELRAPDGELLLGTRFIDYVTNSRANKISAQKMEDLGGLVMAAKEGYISYSMFHENPWYEFCDEINPLIRKDIELLKYAKRNNLNPIDVFIPRQKDMPNRTVDWKKLKPGDMYEDYYGHIYC